MGIFHHFNPWWFIQAKESAGRICTSSWRAMMLNLSTLRARNEPPNPKGWSTSVCPQCTVCMTVCLAGNQRVLSRSTISSLSRMSYREESFKSLGQTEHHSIVCSFAGQTVSRLWFSTLVKSSAFSTLRETRLIRPRYVSSPHLFIQSLTLKLTLKCSL